MILTISLVAIASACWGVMTFYITHGNIRNRVGFFGRDSWKRKYARNRSFPEEVYFMIPSPDNWYYRFFRIKYKEKFPLSATMLVFVTDGFHLFQWIFIKVILLAITQDLYLYLGLWLIWTIIFQLVYTYLPKK